MNQASFPIFSLWPSNAGIWGFLREETEKAMAPTPVLLPGKSHGQRSLVGCSPWGREESDTTERLHFHFSLSCIGEGNGNPLQCSCLEHPRDGGAWWAGVYGVAQSRTRLKRLSSSSSRERRGNLEPCWLFPKSSHGQLLTVVVTCVKLPSAAKPGCSHFPAFSCWVSAEPLWDRSGSHFFPGESEALPWVPGAVGAGGLGARVSLLPWCSWMFQKGVTSSIPAACPHRSSATFCCQRQRQPSLCFSPFSLYLQISFIQAHPLPRHLQSGPGWGQPSHTREVISSCLLAMKGAPPKRWHVWTHTTCKAPFYMSMNHNKRWGNWGRERLGNFPEVTRQKNSHNSGILS